MSYSSRRIIRYMNSGSKFGRRGWIPEREYKELMRIKRISGRNTPNLDWSKVGTVEFQIALMLRN
jgi:hypothetical protein